MKGAWKKLNWISIKELTDWYKKHKVSEENLLVGVLSLVFFTMPLGISLPTIFCGIAVGIWLLSGRAIQAWPIYLRSSWCWPVLMLMVLPWFGLLYAPDSKGLGLDLAGKTHYWLYGLVIASVGRNVPKERLIQAFLLGMAFNALIGGLQFAQILPYKKVGWYIGLGAGYSTLSAYLVVGMLAASFMCKTAREAKKRLYSFGILALFFFHLIILPARSGYVVFLLLLPVIIRNIFPKINRFKIGLVSVLLMGLIFASPIVRMRMSLAIEQLNYHMHTTKSKAWGREFTIHQDRFFMWRSAVQIFWEHPFLGVGTGGYQAALKAKSNTDIPVIAHPHNDLLFMAVHYGMLGIIVFVWFFAQLIRNSWRERDTPLGFFIFSTALVILITGLFNAQMIDAGMAMLLALTTGLQQGLSRFAANTS